MVATQLNTSNDIYGKNDIASLGDNELNIRIKPIDFKVNVKEEGDSTQQSLKRLSAGDWSKGNSCLRRDNPAGAAGTCESLFQEDCRELKQMARYNK